MANRDVDAEFHAEFETELEQLQRRRFNAWVVVWGAYWLVVTLVGGGWLTGGAGVIAAATGWWIGRQKGFAGRQPQRQQREHQRGGALRLAFALLVLTAAVVTVTRSASILSPPSAGGGLGLLIWSFLIAALLLPWTPAQATQAATALWMVWVVGRALDNRFELDSGSLVDASLAALAFLPGVIWRVISQSRIGQRFETSALERYYNLYRRELIDAKKVHAAIFPEPKREGPVRFDYRDRSRLGIGGDYVHATFNPDGALNLVLLDVAGDGIGAALTVNRLHGELERLFAEACDRAPGDVIRALDRYVRLTLAPLGIYAVAMAFRVHPGGKLEWAGAGHAPALVRRAATGLIDRLESTTWTLGASSAGSDPLHATRITRLAPEDVLMACSDGACAERNEVGELLGYSGIERIVGGDCPADPLDWPGRILDAIEQFRGPAATECEDALIVAITAPQTAAATAQPMTAPSSGDVVLSHHTGLLPAHRREL